MKRSRFLGETSWKRPEKLTLTLRRERAGAAQRLRLGSTAVMSRYDADGAGENQDEPGIDPRGVGFVAHASLGTRPGHARRRS